MRFRGFIGPAYTLRSVNFESQRCVNLFPEMNEVRTGKEGEIAALVSSPSFENWALLPEGPVRGLYRASNGTAYGVGGSKLCRLTGSGSVVVIGTLATSVGPVSMADNGQEHGQVLFLADGPNAYTANLLTDAFAKVTEPAFLGSDTVGFLDGYFLGNEPGTGRFFITGLYSSVISGLDYATAEGSPDDLRALIVNNREVWLFGAMTTEVWFNSGNASFPIERVQGAVMEYGCSSPYAVARLDTTIYWPAVDQNGEGIILAATGYQPKRVSNHGIENAMRGQDLSTARAWTYQEGGHQFYVLTFGDQTWVYDTATTQWHERSSLGEDGLEHRHRADCHCYAYGLHLVGDYQTGAIYRMSQDIAGDAVGIKARIRSSPHLSGGGKRLFYHQFDLDVEVGVGLDGDVQGSDPQIGLSWSDDGGHSWTPDELRSLGKVGEYQRKVTWDRLGSSFDRVFRVRVTDPVQVTLLGANLTVSQAVR